MKIYVGNLSYDVTEEEVRQEFLAFGEVESVNIITDKYSGRSKGFGFVEMSSVSEGQQTRVILGILSLVSGACTQSPKQAITATPLEVPKEGSPGEYINVIIQVSSDQPCKLVLSTPHKTEVNNYLSPNTSDMLTSPNSDGTVVFYERIPWETVPGSYVLRVFQMKHDGDKEGKEIFSQDLIVR